MEKYYVLTLYHRRPGVGDDGEIALCMVRPITHDTPPLGTEITIRAQDEEWLSFSVPVTKFTQPTDGVLSIHMQGPYASDATSGLAPLRAEEILRNATPSWQSIPKMDLVHPQRYDAPHL